MLDSRAQRGQQPRPGAVPQGLASGSECILTMDVAFTSFRIYCMGITWRAIEPEGTHPSTENTMNRLLAIALIATPLALLSPQAFAQYTGPGAGTAASTVADARAQRDDHPVVLRGTLISKIGDERYQFRDASGQIEVEIDDEDLPPQAIGADTVVELRGKVDRPTSMSITSPWCPQVEANGSRAWARRHSRSTPCVDDVKRPEKLSIESSHARLARMVRTAVEHGSTLQMRSNEVYCIQAVRGIA